LTESWRDSDSADLGRLRRAGFNVINRPRSRTLGDADDIFVNHGGIVIVAATPFCHRS